MNKRWNNKTFKLQLATLIIATTAIVINFSVLITLDVLKIYNRATVPNKDNIIWTFTQFTWWTTFSYWIALMLRFILIKRELDNKFVNELYKETISLFTSSYLIIVGSLFWSVFFIDLYKTGKVQTFEGNYSFALKFFDFFKTFLVHTIIPILGVMNYIDYNKRKHTEKIHYKYSTTLKFGSIFPTIYLIFYVSFALSDYGYDPYPLTQLKMNKGLWLLPVMIIIFLSVLSLNTLMANKHANKIWIKMNKNKINH